MDGLFRDPYLQQIKHAMNQYMSSNVDISNDYEKRSELLRKWLDWLKNSPDQQNVRINYVILIIALITTSLLFIRATGQWLLPILTFIIMAMIYLYGQRVIHYIEKQKANLRLNQTEVNSLLKGKVDFISLVFDIKITRLMYQMWLFCIGFSFIMHFTARAVGENYAFDSARVSWGISMILSTAVWYYYFIDDIRTLHEYKSQVVGQGLKSDESEEE